MKKLPAFFYLNLFLLLLTNWQVNASHVAGEAITLRQLSNGRTVFQIWLIRDCSVLSLTEEQLTIMPVTGGTFPATVCNRVSTKDISPSCIPNAPYTTTLACTSANMSGNQGSFLMILYESAPINLNQFTFSPNSWVKFYVNNVPCCLVTCTNLNGISQLNSTLSLLTDQNGKIIARSTIKLKEWPQTAISANPSLVYQWSINLLSDSNDEFCWDYTSPKKVVSPSFIQSYNYTGINSGPFPLPTYQRIANTELIQFTTPPFSTYRGLMYADCKQFRNGEHIATVSFYTTILVSQTNFPTSNLPKLPQFGNVPTPFFNTTTPLVYAQPGDSIDLTLFVKNRFIANGMTLQGRLLGELATPCGQLPCAELSELPGTTLTNISYQGQNAGPGVTTTGNDSAQLNFKFKWAPGFQHLRYDSTSANYVPKQFSFLLHAYNTVCPVPVYQYQPLIVSVFSPYIPLVSHSARIVPGDSCRVDVAAPLDTSSNIANSMGVDFFVYRNKQSQMQLYTILEKSNSPFGPFNRCSSQKLLVYNPPSFSFLSSLTDSTQSGSTAQYYWYRVVTRFYSRGNLISADTTASFQPFISNNQLPQVEVKPDTVCLNTPIRLYASSTNGTQNPIYQWRLNGQLQISNTDVLMLPRLLRTDSVRVEMTSRPLGASTIVVSSATVSPARIQGLFPLISRQGDSLVSSLAFGNQWYNLGSGGWMQDTTFWIKPVQGNFGPYTVVNQQKYCAVNSPDTVSFFPVNVQHINLEDVTMFPQPTSNQLHLKVPEHHEVALVEVYDLQGKLIKSIRYQQEQFLLSINVKTLPNGVYVLRLIMDGKEVRKKFQVFHP